MKYMNLVNSLYDFMIKFCLLDVHSLTLIEHPER